MADVLNALSIESLQDLYFHDNPEHDQEKKLKKKEIIDHINDRLDKYAIDIFVATIPLKELKVLAEKAKVQFKEEDNKNSKSVLSRRLTEQIVAVGLDDFLKNSVDADSLKSVAEDFDCKADAKNVAETARALAAERYFSGFDVESLRALAEDLKLKNAAQSSSKRKLVEAIVGQEDAEAPEPKKKKQKKSTDVGKKKPLEKGITYDEIFQHYYMEELRDFVKQNGIKVSGKKPVLIKRILAFLDGNTEGIMAGEKTEKKKRKKASSGKKKSGAKKSSKKEQNGSAE